MKPILVALILTATAGSSLLAEEPIFSGKVESVYYNDYRGNIHGYTRLEKGLPGTSTTVGEDVHVEIYQNWIIIELLARKNKTAVPRERVLEVYIGNEEANALNPAREATAYTCNMHPQIRQPKKGTCPICGMDLVLHKENNEEQPNK